MSEHLKFCYLKRIPERNVTGIFKAIAKRGRYWPLNSTLYIYFIGGTTDQIDSMKETIEYMLSFTSLKVAYTNDRYQSDIRISFKYGYGSYSYLGTDCKFIPKDEETLNLGWAGKDVERHEFGHTLNLFHEHQNPKGGLEWNRQAVIDDLSGPPNYWSVAQIEHNVLNPINLEIADATEFDRHSIMLYSFPASWTKNGFSGGDNTDLSQTDKDFLISKYTKSVDDVAPELTIIGGAYLTLMLGQPYIEYGATAIDDVDGDISDQITINSNVDTGVVGIYRVEYSISDFAGNVARKVRSVMVEDIDDGEEEEKEGCRNALGNLLLATIGAILLMLIIL
jgi:hypothetical protein